MRFTKPVKRDIYYMDGTVEVTAKKLIWTKGDRTVSVKQSKHHRPVALLRNKIDGDAMPLVWYSVDNEITDIIEQELAK